MKTDLQLQKDVMEELKWEPGLNATDISVVVKNCVVILSGQVSSYTQKLVAEEAVRRVKDVKGLVENITVHLSDSSQRSDPVIAVAVMNALKWNNAIPDKQITAELENGWLTLAGKVSWQFQKDAVINTVKDITGLKGVTCLVTIKPVINVPVIREAINAALERSADIEASRIIVETAGNKIILIGKARSWRERNEVVRAAWCAPGVMEVEDDLIIVP